MRALLLASVLALGWVGAARAAFTLDFEQVGSNVTATGNGFIITAGLGGPVAVFQTLYVDPATAEAILGAPRGGTGPQQGGAAGTAFLYPTTVTGIAFGSKGTTFESLATGAVVGINPGYVVVPENYISGSALSNTALFANNSFSGLGLTLGTYVYSFGSGANRDTFTIQVGPLASAVPEPTTLALLGAGVLGLAAKRKRRG